MAQSAGLHWISTSEDEDLGNRMLMQGAPFLHFLVCEFGKVHSVSSWMTDVLNSVCVRHVRRHLGMFEFSGIWLAVGRYGQTTRRKET